MSSVEVCKCENRLYEPVILLAQQYYEATGVSVRVFDSDVQEIYRVDHPSWSCQFCHHMRSPAGLTHSNDPEPKEHCNRTHVFGAVRARQLGGHYVYQCRSGFTFWSSPIVINGRYFASVVAGSTILTERKDFIKNMPQYHQGRKVDAQGISMLDRIQSAPESRVIALAEILYLSCHALSQKHSHLNVRDLAARPVHSGELIFNAEFTLYQELLVLLESGNHQEAVELTLRVLKKIEQAMAGDFLGIKEHALDLAIFLSNAINQQNSGDFTLNVQFVRDLQQVNTMQGLQEWLVTVIQMLGSIPSRLNQLKYGHLLVQALRYMHKNFANNITLDEVAKIAKLSPSYFSRLFKTEMGVSFTEYLNQIRVNESKRKLQFTNLSLSEIATACGFSDQSYFTKIFKRAEGLSPGRYRHNQAG